MPNLDSHFKHPHPLDCDCQTCLMEYGDHFEAVLLMDRLAARDPERTHGAKPATDREWREHLDAEFPKATLTLCRKISRVDGRWLHCQAEAKLCCVATRLPYCLSCWSSIEQKEREQIPIAF